MPQDSPRPSKKRRLDHGRHTHSMAAPPTVDLPMRESVIMREPDNRHQTIAVQVPTASFPSSLFLDEDRHGPPDTNISSETTLLDKALEFWSHIDPQPLDYREIPLFNFEIYRKAGLHSKSLVSLEDLKNRIGHQSLAFNGSIKVGTNTHDLRDVDFDILCVDGYGASSRTISAVFIQSEQGKARQTFYRLLEPSRRYCPYYETFLWVATFTKHTVDYMSDMSEHKNVNVHSFRRHFRPWLLSRRGGTKVFDDWLTACECKDFSVVFAAHYEYIWKEATDVDYSNRLHHIFKELDTFNPTSIPAQTVTEYKTVVTPYVFRCFQDSSFSKHLKSVRPATHVDATRMRRAKAMRLSGDLPQNSLSCRGTVGKGSTGKIGVGDVVAVERDRDGPWKDNADQWFGLVQRIETNRKRRKVLRLIWLYKPSDTTCAKGFYPFSHELFLSDHCNCEDTEIYEQDVQDRVDVRMFAQPNDHDDTLFVRQTYITPDETLYKDAAFLTLRREHFHCPCSDTTLADVERVRMHFRPGMTILVRRPGHDLLEPGILHKYIDNTHVSVHRLIRRTEYRCDSTIRANELLATRQTYNVTVQSVIRQCHVRKICRRVIRDGQIPPPYCYNGAADCWILSGAITASGEAYDVDEVDMAMIPDFHESPDLARTQQIPLRGLSLFGGAGLLDRGLEDAGGVAFPYIVEWDKHALASHKANVKKPQEDHHFFLGSVNDYFLQVVQGAFAKWMAPIGAISLIVAGSPCKGFSRAQPYKQSDKSKGYASLVASVIAFIHTYCPAYAILENVFDMCQACPDGSNVLSQVICALVGLGYQVQTFLLDAWAHGSSQSRSRLFVSIAAPGFEPLVVPPQTHAHPPGVVSRKVGRTQSGEAYGFRRFEYCPFEFLSARKAVGDLPNIGTGNLEACVWHADHVLPGRMSHKRTSLVSWIPRFPKCQGLVEAELQHRIPQAVLDSYGNEGAERRAHGSRAFRRIDGDRFLPTIRTANHVNDARMGQQVHWDQNRMISLLEARRAQSIPDDELLIGTPAKKWELVGNGVDRKTAVALGMSLRQAWSAAESQRRMQELDRALSDGPALGSQQLGEGKSPRTTQTFAGVYVPSTSRIAHKRASSATKTGTRGRERTSAPASNPGQDLTSPMPYNHTFAGVLIPPTSPQSSNRRAPSRSSDGSSGRELPGLSRSDFGKAFATIEDNQRDTASSDSGIPSPLGGSSPDSYQEEQDQDMGDCAVQRDDSSDTAVGECIVLGSR